MPCLRGIELSLIIQPDSVLLPEFPHPDASSVRVVSLSEAAQKIAENEASSPGPDSTRIQKLAPRASVYIPSTPGSQFCVQYYIRRRPDPPCYFFFKLFINGRHITNCGIKPDTVSGTISRALYEPSDRWHSKQNGTLLKRNGIESRSFCFSPGPHAIAAADDGGLIQIQVFRAKSRRRSTPQLVPHRDQQQYGIISPSTGLLEHPEDAIYYEWVLYDAVEAPFATFCFHYRAWTYLWDLNLAADDSNSLLHNSRLRERLGRNRRRAMTHGKSQDEAETIHVELDLGNCDENADRIRNTEPQTAAHAHYPSQGIVLPNKELKPLEMDNGLLSRRKKASSYSTAPFTESSRSCDPFTTTLLPPVIEEEDSFMGPCIPLRHKRINVPLTRSYSRESLYSRFRQPLPTVNEVPRLE
ncbi:hypothetical protein ACHAQJ_008248 [Trichoderma viride]